MARKKGVASKSKKASAATNKSASRTKSVSQNDTFAILNKWNIGLAALHALQGFAVLILSKSATLPVDTHFLTEDKLASKATGQIVLSPAVRHLFDINLAYLVVAFFFMSAIAHLVIGTIYRTKYEEGLKKGINKARWIEYAFSASTMMVAIAMLTGVYDFSLLAAVFGLTAIMNLMGLVMEVHNQTTSKTNWLSYIIGCISGILPWMVVAVYLKGAMVYGSGNIPTFVYWIFGSMFVLFSTFAVNMFLQYKKKGKWADYLYGEKMYMILSLVAKSALAWQVFAGTLRP